MTADTVGGVWTYAMELTRGLADHGVRVYLAAMGGRLNSEQKLEARSLPNLQVFESHYKLEWMPDPWDDVRAAGLWLLELGRHLRPDIVHLNNYAHVNLTWNAPTVVVAHSCVLSWWRAVLGEDCTGEAWKAYRSTVARGLRAARSVVAPSRHMLGALYAHYSPIPAGQVIPNGRSSSMFEPGPKEEFILTAGRLWDKAKNVQLLDRVAPSLCWPIRVAGESHQPSTREMVRFRGLETLGRLSPGELRTQYGKAAIYAAPAKYEPFGLSILEAALSGCALVLGNIPSLREIWNEAAVFVDPAAPGQLQRALKRLIESPMLRRSLALRARKRALQYSVPRMADGYMGVYRKLLEPAARKTSKVLEFAIPKTRA